MTKNNDILQELISSDPDASKHPSYASVAQLKKVGTGNVPGIRRMEQADNRQRKPSIMYGRPSQGL